MRLAVKEQVSLFVGIAWASVEIDPWEGWSQAGGAVEMTPMRRAAGVRECGCDRCMKREPLYI